MTQADARRRWLAPEVVQTSAMDCGPASLKCLLEGFYISAGYGRLREACQTDVDGTSIDAIELTAQRLGLDAEQVMLPPDRLFLPEAEVLPAMVVVDQADGSTHFVVVWRRFGPWLQTMDPAVGRRWIACRRFAADLHRHALPVPAAEWRAWAGTEEFLAPLRRHLIMLGAAERDAEALLAAASARPGWRALAALDAGTRMVAALLRAGGLESGRQALGLLTALIERAEQDAAGAPPSIPDAYWSVAPLPDEPGEEERVLLRGAVLLKIKGRRAPTPADEAEAETLSPELSAALQEAPIRPLRTLLEWLRADGLFTPLALFGALGVSVGGVLLEAALFRGLFDIAWQLNLAHQRLGAALGLVAFGALLLLVELPIAAQSLRLGRRLEIRLRMALLSKLARLDDRYLQSRPVSDMAERAHSLSLIRLLPGLAIQFAQTLWDILFTLAGILFIDPNAAPWAIALVALAIALPLAAQPWLSERDLRVRGQAGALHGFYLDALQGLAPARTHGAERAVRREHEALLTEWARSARGLIVGSLLLEGFQSCVCLGLAGWLLFGHLQRDGVDGGILLLAYWTLKLPAVGQRLAGLIQQYPAQRNILLRLLEPLHAPEEASAPNATQDGDAKQTAVGIDIADGAIVAGGHDILQEINLTIAPGEHVAVVGVSGAGKSTLLGLLLGWHKLAGGALLIDGAPADGARLEALRRETAWVDPAIQLWNRPFLDNLEYARDGNGGLAELSEIVDAADLRGVLRTLPEGMQTSLGEGGALLSGGEGQRVRLGRALLQDGVRLVLLDEPFRGLDRGQRRRLLTQAKERWRDATLLCVTHDVGETRLFDRVLVVENGRIVEDGAPARLLAAQTRYRELLTTEASLLERLRQANDWRRVEIRDGRAVTAGASE